LQKKESLAEIMDLPLAVFSAGARIQSRWACMVEEGHVQILLLSKQIAKAKKRKPTGNLNTT